MKNRIFYSGDINPEYGGFFYTLEGVKWGYVSVLRITPCSDAGGPDNLFWLESLTVNLRDGDKLGEILRTCSIDAEWMDELSKAQKIHAIIDAHVSYGAYDQDQSTMVQVGKPDPLFDHRGEWDQPRVDVQLRAGTCIGKYAKRKFHEYV